MTQQTIDPLPEALALDPEVDAAFDEVREFRAELDADILPDWETWAARIGHAVLPAVQRLIDDLPTLRSAMVASADGFNFCAVGISPERVQQVATMTSALLSIADSASGDGESSTEPIELLTLTHGSATTVVVGMRDTAAGPLLLRLCVEGESVSTLHSQTRAAVAEIQRAVAHCDH